MPEDLTSLHSLTGFDRNVVTLSWLSVEGRWPNRKLGFLKNSAKVSLHLNLVAGDLCHRRALVALMTLVMPAIGEN